MSYENWISYRYLTSKKGGFLIFLNFVSVVGVALGVCALIVVLSVMTGFGNNLREKIIGTNPHITIEKETGVRDYAQVIREVRALDGVVGASAYVHGSIFLEEEGQALNLIVRGVDPVSEGSVTKVEEYLTKGRIHDLKANNVFIGHELARYFGYEVGDTITLISPNSGIAGEGWRYDVVVGGVFETGMADVDMNLIIVNLKKAQEIFRVEDDLVSGVGLKLNDPYAVDDVKKIIYKEFGYSYLVKTWIDTNSNLFKALKLEKLGLRIVLTMMVVVAAFSIVSTLIVTVMSKVNDIGVLQSIGVPSAAICRIFIQQGMLIGLRGILWGVVIGLGICYYLKNYFEVPADIYIIDHVPVEIVWQDMLGIVGSAIIIVFLASVFPAWKASRLEPVEALRYE